MAAGMEHFGKAYTAYLEPDSTIQGYGRRNRPAQGERA